MKKFILIVLACLFVIPASAETVWVICQPDSYVNVRTSPSKSSEANGMMECGYSAETDGSSKNGFLYLSHATTEDGDGWINKGYIVYTQPIITTFQTNIYSKGRVACWRYIGGPRRCWVREGDVVTVHAISSEWSVTNKGFIKTKYLGVDYNDLTTRKLDARQTNTESDDLHFEDN